MILYHFCANKHIKAIHHKGLTIGAVVVMHPFGWEMHSGWIWLTMDPDPKHQSWATSKLIGYSRTAWRLTIEIPDAIIGDRLYDRARLTALYPETEEQLFEGWPGSDDWRIWHGTIPPKWITKFERMEA